MDDAALIVEFSCAVLDYDVWGHNFKITVWWVGSVVAPAHGKLGVWCGEPWVQGKFY